MNQQNRDLGGICARCGDALVSGKPFCPGCGRHSGRGAGRKRRSSANSGLVNALLLVGGGLVAIAIALGVLGGVSALKRTFSSMGRSIGPSCSFGVTGTAASVTFRGWPAMNSCGQPDLGVALYHADPGSFTTPVICQYDISDFRATVRDEGVLKLVGNAMCQALRAKAAS